MKQIILSILMLISSVALASSPKDTTKTKQDLSVIPSTGCNCVYPLKANKETMVYCHGEKGAPYCINRKGNRTYKSSIK